MRVCSHTEVHSCPCSSCFALGFFFFFVSQHKLGCEYESSEKEIKKSYFFYGNEIDGHNECTWFGVWVLFLVFEWVWLFFFFEMCRGWFGFWKVRWFELSLGFIT